MAELAFCVWSWVEPAHLGSHWLSPLQKDCHNCCTGGQGLLGDRDTARCGVHMNARWSPQGSSHTGGMRRCPVVGSGTPVWEWFGDLRSEIRAWGTRGIKDNRSGEQCSQARRKVGPPVKLKGGI